MRRPVLILTLLSALAAPLAPVPAAAAATTAPAVRWTPCAEDPAADCGTLTVPVDWNDPRAGTFELALARRGASDPA
ncbi:peptidase S33 family protein, partial [Nonomuraea sp. NPDC001023]